MVDLNNQVPFSYPDYSSGTAAISSGDFSSTFTDGSSISGTFRGMGATKVGGVFDVPNRYKGGFVADKN